MNNPWTTRSTTGTEDDIVSSDIGENLLQNIFDFFRVTAVYKINIVRESEENPSKPLCHTIIRGYDSKFDRLIVALSCASQSCLPNFAKDLLVWWGQARGRPLTNTYSTQKVTISKEFIANQKQAMATDYLFCRILVEMLSVENAQTLPEEVGRKIESLAFQTIINSESMYQCLSQKTRSELVDSYATLIGVLTITRFDSCIERFFSELKGNGAVDLIRGMTQIRLQTYPILNLERSAKFLLELGEYFVTLKDKMYETKQALSELFVALMIPWAAIFKSEVNLPAIRKLVETVYPKVIKSKQLHLSFITVLLCCSQKQFFLEKWPGFLTQCLSSMKESKVSQEAILSIHRCLWVYMYRVGGQSNQDTESRMKSINAKCFPKSQNYGVSPKDTPIDVFVDILLFMSEIRIDFVFREAIFPLLGTKDGRVKISQLCPIRMAIAVKAARVIVDMRLKKEKPKFCQGALKDKRNYERFFVHQPLTSDETLELGFGTFYTEVRKVLGSILLHINNIIWSERMEQYEDYVILYIIILSCIPRLFPTGLPEKEVIYTICTLMTHPEQRLRKEAFATLTRIIELLPQLAKEVVQSFATAILRHVEDSVTVMDPALVMLEKLIGVWLSNSQLEVVGGPIRMSGSFSSERGVNTSAHTMKLPPTTQPSCSIKMRSPTISGLIPTEIDFMNETLRKECEGAMLSVERLCLLCLCSTRPSTRQLALEVLVSGRKLMERCEGDVAGMLITIIEREGVSIAKEYIALRMKDEDIDSVTLEYFYYLLENESTEWHVCLGTLIKKLLKITTHRLIVRCWETICERFIGITIAIDQVKRLSDVPGAEFLASISGSSSDMFSFSRALKGFSKEETLPEQLMSRWINYLTFLCAAAPTDTNVKQVSSKSSIRKLKDTKHLIETTGDLFKFVIPFIRHEEDEIGKTIIYALANVNYEVYPTLVQELKPYHSLCTSLKSDKKRRQMRERLACILEFSSVCYENTILLRNEMLRKYFVSYVNETLSYLQSQNDDGDDLNLYIKLHFSNHLFFMMEQISKAKVIDSYLPKATRKQLYDYFSTVSGLKANVQKKNYDGQNKLTPKRVHFVAVRSMVSMFHGDLFIPFETKSSKLSYDHSIFKDITFMLLIKRLQQLGTEAVCHILRYNQKDSLMLDIILYLCYVSKMVPARGYFLALAHVLQTDELKVHPQCLVRIITIVLYQTGNANQKIRTTAINLMTLLIKKYLRGSQATPQHLSVTSVLSATYTLSQQELSADLAKNHPEQTQAIIGEIVRRVPIIPHAGQERLLYCLVPWMRKVSFSSKDIDEDVTLCYLFDLTVNFEESHPKTIETLWKALGEQSDNLEVIIDFLLDLGTRVAMTSSSIIPHAQKIAVYLGRKDPDRTFNKIVENFKVIDEGLATRKFNKTQNALAKFLLQENTSEIEHVKMTRAIFTLCICVELATEAPYELLCVNLPVFLHLIIINMDNQSPIVYQLSKTLLSNILHCIVVRIQVTEPKAYNDAQELIDRLIQDETRLWKVVDFLNDDYDSNFATLSLYVQELARILSYVSKNIQQELEQQSHYYAISCANCQSANRSLQISRSLDFKLSGQAFADLISRLANSVIDEEFTVHSYVIELMATVKARVQNSDVDLLKKFPQILWTAIIILDSNEEYEWKCAIELLNAWMDIIPIKETKLLLEELKWGNYPGLQRLVIKGLMSSINMESSLDTLARFTLLLDGCKIMSPTDNGLLFNMVALIPYLISEFELPSERALLIATNLTKVCNDKGFSNLSKLFALYGNNESTFIKSGDQWVKDICKYIAEAYFPDHETSVFNLLLVLLESAYNIYEEAIYAVLNGLLASVKVNDSKYAIHGADPSNLVHVLMRAIDTESWETALPTIKITMKKWARKNEHLNSTSNKLFGTKIESVWSDALKTQSVTRLKLCNVLSTFTGVTLNIKHNVVAFDKERNDNQEEEAGEIKRAITQRVSKRKQSETYFKQNWRATIKKGSKREPTLKEITKATSATSLDKSGLLNEKSLSTGQLEIARSTSTSKLNEEAIYAEAHTGGDVEIDPAYVSRLEMGNFLSDFESFLQNEST